MNATKEKPCVLVCEDEMFVAMMLQDRLEGAGFSVIMAPRVAKGVELAASEAIDVALLDINMADEESFPVAEKLRARGIPFLFSSGYDDQWLPDEWSNEKLLRKPYDTKTVTAALNEKLGIGGATSG
ncbi:MAG TPA: response regulator [Oleiagrimonas sp.]|nr:response regulator [Oleiagrimonas sp.]